MSKADLLINRLQNERYKWLLCRPGGMCRRPNPLGVAGKSAVSQETLTAVMYVDTVKALCMAHNEKSPFRGFIGF